MNHEEISVWRMMILGGPFMIPILACSIFVIGIIIDKFYLFHKIKINVTQFKSKIFELLRSNKIKDALQLCEETPSPIAKIMKSGIIKYGCSREEIKDSIEEVSLYEIPRLELRLNALATLAHISPLLGFLGTMITMVVNFNSFKMRAVQMMPISSGDLAGGIAEALLTTVAGLMIAVPAYIAYNYFISRIHYHVIEMEQAATELINFMSQNNEIAP